MQSDAETRKCAQKSANERKSAQTQVRKRAQKGAKERFRAKIANNQVCRFFAVNGEIVL